MAGEITDRKLYSFENIEMQAIIEIIDEAVKGNNSIAAIGISIPGQTKDEKIFVSWNEKLNGWNLKCTKSKRNFGFRNNRVNRSNI